MNSRTKGFWGSQGRSWKETSSSGDSGSQSPTDSLRSISAIVAAAVRSATLRGFKAMSS